ncbi:hypothetical protein BOTBODRAFT_28232 [Botryobasidium botryosum FD-172 SS1]|uniref:F-box domain-containing protein n=1 Tax=Botryobasidium botryosum (strain FD-172 SS1) TaxID=930990 RepID=A0A067N6A0_BOTB1|nr:hypothetical protein BOTBODRAFT_28232 [Botryobasidium botryosum FD-172 SS1]
MCLTQLNDDVLSNICSFLTTRRSLLNLALTCRAFCTLIIPAFLYARLESENPYIGTSAAERLGPFFDAIRQHESVARAIRHLEIPSCANVGRLLRDDLPIMRNIRALHIYTLPPRTLLTRISMMTHLQSLTIKFDSGELLELLRGRRFRRLELFMRCGYNLTPDSALGEILLCSRVTLHELKLFGITWCFRTPSISRDGKDPIWPHVTRLGLWCVGSGGHPLNLTYHFPSVVCFDTFVKLEILDQSYNRSFFSGIRSLKGNSADLKLVASHGAKLRRVHIDVENGINTESVHDSLLHSTLQSLTLLVGRKFPFRCFEQLSVLCPKVEFLSLHVESSSSLSPLLNSILHHLSALPLGCLYIGCGYVGESDAHLASNDHDREVTMLASLAPKILPSLRFISLTSFRSQTHMRRLISARGVADEFTKISSEDGFDSLHYYEWRWMDQAEHAIEPS